MDENKENKKAVDPFVYLDNCGAVIDNLEYDNGGRLTYMPYKGIDYRIEEGEKCNKIIGSPDEFYSAKEYDSVSLQSLNNPAMNLNPILTTAAVNNYTSNLMVIMEGRLESEITTHVISIFNSGLRELYFEYLNNHCREIHEIDTFISRLHYLGYNDLFKRDNYNDNGRIDYAPQREIYPITDPNEIVVKACRISSEFITDIAARYNDFITNILPALDIHRFADNALQNMGLTRDQVSEDNDIPYILSVMHERASYDLMKIAELVEMSVHHAFYMFANSVKEYYSYLPNNKLPDKQYQQKYIAQKELNPYDSDIINEVASKCANSVEFADNFKDALLNIIKEKSNN